MTRLLMTTLTLGLLATGAAHAADTDKAASPAPASGIFLNNLDSAVRPQDDFFVHLNGNWLKRTDIPADKSSWGAFATLRDDVLPQLRGLIEAAGADRKASGERRKIADLYASYLDEKKRDSLGIAPVSGELNRIRSLRDKKGLPILIDHLTRLGVSTPYLIHVSQDARASTRYAVGIAQSGLGLPDRDYYLNQNDPKLAAVRAQYQQHVARTLALAGDKDAAASAKAVVALETALAQAQRSKAENRDPVLRYNKMSLDQLAGLTPGYDWKMALGAAGVASKTDYVIVGQPDYLRGFAALLETTGLNDWKAYFEWQLLRTVSPYLSRDFVDADFAFYGTVVTGVPAQAPLWKRGVAAVDGALGEAVGKLYVEQYFPPERKARMDALVHNLLEAYRVSLDTLEWMSPETRQAAQAKLAKFRPKIGYPSQWRDYTALAIVPGDLVGNMLRASHFSYNRMLNKLGQPIAREEWSMTPQTVNAYYSSTMNEIVFPAAILQPPFFDAAADDAVNYGAIGAVIGHEISHGFDDGGSQFDGDGNLRDWWSGADRAAFKRRADALVRQYDGYSPLPGYQVNGKLTLGENIADNSGLAIAYKAYQLSLRGQPAPQIDGLSGAQRFYMGWGQVWRVKMREAQQIVQLKSDNHAPGQFRVNGTLRNQPGFYEAFGVQPGDALYLAPEQRVLIW